MPQHLNCPACSAPLDYSGAGATMRCPYCNTNVIVPEALRPRPAEREAAVVVRSMPRAGAQATVKATVRVPGGKRRMHPAAAGCLGWLVLLTAVGSIGFGAYVALMSSGRAVSTVSTQTAAVVTDLMPEVLVVEEALGGFAVEEYRFGREGIGAGHFTDARAIALDNDGRVYVGDYDTGRIQVFEEDGSFRTQWMLPKDSYVDSFAVTRDRILYAPVRSELHAYVADTGHLLNAQAADEDSWLQAAGLEEVLPGWFQDSVALAPDGGLVTVIDESIVRFNATGDPVLVIADAIPSVSDEPETTTIVAIDGLGNIYALGQMQGVVYKFGADGRYLSRFGGAPFGGNDDSPGVLRSSSALAVDNQGRVYVNDIDGIEVYDSEGRWLALIDVPGYAFGLAFNDAGLLFAAHRDQVIVYRVLGDR